MAVTCTFGVNPSHEIRKGRKKRSANDNVIIISMIGVANVIMAIAVPVITAIAETRKAVIGINNSFTISFL